MRSDKETTLVNNAIGDNDLKPKLTANCFFNYVSDIKYIKESLKDKKLYARYCEENYNFINLNTSLRKVYIPMKCFCDIKLSASEEHMNFYGHYGLGFKREWGYENNLEKVTYLNLNSTRTQALVNALDSYTISKINSQNSNKLSDDFIFTSLIYSKPHVGTIKNRESNEQVIKYFDDENEWRFIPDIKNPNFPQILHENIIAEIKSKNKESMAEIIEQKYNQPLKQSGLADLPFKYDDLKYIIVKTENDALELSDFIYNLDIDFHEKQSLIRKIEISDETRGDY